MVEGLFAELRVPIFKDAPGAHLLEISAAVRHEYYSDTSNPTVPKVTLRYLPFNDEFALRGTYSRSFSAPTLYELFGPSSIGFTDPYDLTTKSGAVLPDTQNNSQSGSNPALQPSKSKNYTVGFVYSPKAVKGLSISLDYWNIQQTNLISSIGATTIAQDVETNGTASQYVDHVHIGSFTGPLVTGPGQISAQAPDNVYIFDTLVNIASDNLSGYDLTLKYTYNADFDQPLRLPVECDVLQELPDHHAPGAQPEETVGLSTTANGTLPRWLAYNSTDFKRGNYGAFIGMRYIPSLTDLNDGSSLSSFQSWDLSVSYEFGSELKWLSGAKVTLGVNDVFNKFGPLDPSTWTDSNVDTGTYGAIGRFVYADVPLQVL